MPITREYIQTNRPAIFDYAVILISFSMGFIFPTNADFIRSGVFYNLMLFAVGCYIAGAMIKHLPLSVRLAAMGKTDHTSGYRFFLLFGHWITFFFLFIMLEHPLRRLLYFPSGNGDPAYSGIFITIAPFFAAGVTWLVYRSREKFRQTKSYSPHYLFNRELAADILLIAGVSVLNFFFWEKGVMEMLTKSRTDTIGDIWFLFLLFAVLFIAYYLPLRYLFLVEDKPGSNTRRLLYIFGFILFRVLVEMLGASVTGKQNL